MSRPRQVSDEQILTAAREAFLELGPAASTAVIAEKLGVSQAALFKRFGSKDKLLVRALVPQQDPPWIAICDLGPDDRPLDVQLIELGLSVAEFFEKFVPCMAVLRAAGVHPEFAEIMGQDKPPPVRGTDSFIAFVRRAQRAGQLRDDLDPRVFVSSFLGGLLHRAFIDFVSAGHLEMQSAEDHVNAVVPLLLRGAQGKTP